MNTSHFRWQFQTVCYGSNPFNNSEWTNVPWVQFSSLLKLNHSFPRSYFKKHQVIYFEFQFLSSIVGITFLSVLCHFKPFPDNTNLSEEIFISSISFIFRTPTLSQHTRVLHFCPYKALKGAIPILA